MWTVGKSQTLMHATEEKLILSKEKNQNTILQVTQSKKRWSASRNSALKHAHYSPINGQQEDQHSIANPILVYFILAIWNKSKLKGQNNSFQSTKN